MQHDPQAARSPRLDMKTTAELASGVDSQVWLSTQDVARRLNIPVKTLAAWAADGRGPRFARMGRYRRYRLTDLLLWEKERLDLGGGSTPR
ncbi:helix-turn-helix domain-containing protein [Nocardia cyriacigeorgica]|uniref:helix-turn-helix domain-containing protein n=1 Tax=Nocardia cyriacigeorgica TaxID=135487 RepID=UPI002B4AF7FB|nr:helix-turn-helix domain-containing protein [Nocardia cyriacigeorgica]